ncbi:MAG: HEAT repeat domain-containing protein [Steroidobacteraceae bacterium]
MAHSFSFSSNKSIGLEEYVEIISANVDTLDIDSVADSAEHLYCLGNNKTFAAEVLNQQLKEGVLGVGFYSSQSAILKAVGNIAIRLNVWPVVSGDPRKAKIENEIYSYGDAHDHNFIFMTVGYHGPGYRTIIREYDRNKTIGYVGEKVDMKVIEETDLPMGKVMLYRPFKDIHTQIPPSAFSMSLNLLISDPKTSSLTQQYYFDVEKGEIVDFVESYSSKRVSVVECLRYIGDGNSVDLLDNLGATHPCVRTRWAALETLVAINPEDAERYWERAACDLDPLVRRAAQARLTASNT